MTGKKARHVRPVVTLPATIFVLFLALTAAQCPSAGEGDGDGEEITQRLYIGDYGKVLVVDPVAQSVVATITIPGGQYLYWLAMRPDMQKLYCSDTSQNKVYIIDTATNTKTNEISVNIHPKGIAFTADSAKAAVTRHEGGSYGVVDIIDAVTETNLGQRYFGGINSLAGIDINYVTNKLYAAGVNGCIFVSDVSTGSTGDWQYSLFGGPCDGWDVEVSLDGSKLYVSGNVGSISNTDLFVSTINGVGSLSSFDSYERPGSSHPDNRVRVSYDNSKLYFTNYSYSSVDAINTSDPGTMTPIAITGGDGTDVAFSLDSSIAYVLSGTNLKIYLVDTATKTVTGSFDLTGGFVPRTMVYAVLP